MFYSPMDLVDCTINQQEDGTFLSTDPAAISAASGMAIYGSVRKLLRKSASTLTRKRTP